MPDTPSQDWSSLPKRALEYEFMAEVLKVRARLSREDSKWERLLNSKVATAFVSLLMTAVLGNVILSLMQERNKEREIELLAYRENLMAQLKTVERAYELIGGVRAAAEDLIAITQPEFHLSRFGGRDSKSAERLKKQIYDVQSNYNTIIQKWRSEQEALGFLMAYYHHDRPEVLGTWGKMQEGVSAFAACAEKWHNAQIGDQEVSRNNGAAGSTDPCRAQAEEASRQLSELRTKLEQTQSSTRKK